MLPEVFSPAAKSFRVVNPNVFDIVNYQISMICDVFLNSVLR